MSRYIYLAQKLLSKLDLRVHAGGAFYHLILKCLAHKSSYEKCDVIALVTSMKGF